MKGFLQRILQKIMTKNNTWNIRYLVNETINPATQRITLKIVRFQVLADESVKCCLKVHFKINSTEEVSNFGERWRMVETIEWVCIFASSKSSLVNDSGSVEWKQLGTLTVPTQPLTYIGTYFTVENPPKFQYWGFVRV